MNITSILVVKVQTMDDMLFRKVEELALYMIRMQKQMDELKAENSNLKNEIQNLKSDK